MIWDWLVQRTGKYCSIRRIEYPEFQTGIFGRMESAPGIDLVQRTGKYCSIRRIKYPEFQIGIFGRMESALS